MSPVLKREYAKIVKLRRLGCSLVFYERRALRGNTENILNENNRVAVEYWQFPA